MRCLSVFVSINCLYMMIIGLEPFDTFKINDKAEIVYSDFSIDDSLLNHEVKITKTSDYSIIKGVVTDINEANLFLEEEKNIRIRKNKKESILLTEKMIKFLEVLS